MIIYKANPINQFNEFTALSSQLKNNKMALYVSTDLLSTIKCNEGDMVSVEANGSKLELEVSVDTQLGGNIAYVPYYLKEVDSGQLFNGYRFNNAKINKI